MLVFERGMPMMLTRDGRRFVVCNGALGEEDYPGAMLGDPMYGGRMTTGCRTIIDVTDAAEARPESGCGQPGHGPLPSGATVVEPENPNEAGQT